MIEMMMAFIGEKVIATMIGTEIMAIAVTVTIMRIEIVAITTMIVVNGRMRRISLLVSEFFSQ